MDKQKRATLKTITKSILLAGTSLSFGSQISPLFAADQKVALFYASKYGATFDTSKWIAEGMSQKTAIVNINDNQAANTALNQNAKFILGSAVYRERPMDSMLSFIETHAQQLGDRVVASFVVCGTQANSDKNQQRINHYLHTLNEPLLHKPSLSRQLGGRLIVEKLDAEDRAKLTRFYNKVLKKPLLDWDRTDRALAMRLAQEIKL